MEKQIQFPCPYCGHTNNQDIHIKTMYLFSDILNCSNCDKQVWIEIEIKAVITSLYAWEKVKE